MVNFRTTYLVCLVKLDNEPMAYCLTFHVCKATKGLLDELENSDSKDFVRYIYVLSSLIGKNGLSFSCALG